jgi:hypothetical protein
VFVAQFGIFVYALLSMFVITAMSRNQREQRPSSEMMTMVGWGLFSLSSTLAVLMTGLAVALAMGWNLPTGMLDALK